MRYADVIIDISHEKVDRPFGYRIPARLQDVIQIGSCVQIPFGAGNTQRIGYVIGLRDSMDYPDDKIKEIIGLAENQVGVQDTLIQTAAWIRKRYGGTMIQALRVVMPVKKTVKKLTYKEIHLSLTTTELEQAIMVCARKHQSAKLRLLQALSEQQDLPYRLVADKLHVSGTTIAAMQKQGYISVSEETVFRNPVKCSPKDVKRVSLSDMQQHIIRTVMTEYDQGVAGKYLIHGITGSGKTEVYLGIAESMVKQGKQVIMMIPEISLTYQTLMRFYQRFGERVSVMNSSLSQGERYDQYQRALRGELDVIIGPRSAIFTPFERLGAIIIDEEHENSYKSENTPRFHAREVAEWICERQRAILVLGSATPSMEAFQKAQSGEYTLFTLNRRLTGGTLPTVEVIDLRQELREGNHSIFSKSLQAGMQERLEKGQQIMLFLNRRGYAGFISCRSCGTVLKCPHCEVSLTQHNNGRLICHYCGYQTPSVRKCPSCGSPYIAGFKIGTQQVEDAVQKMFPQARVLRMDRDTTAAKDSYEKLLQTFADGDADILVGTQMIVKGHDFPNVTLVGILAADLSLNSHDFRAGERTFQLLTQAAGRAGRGSIAGNVVIQTYQPEHYSVIHASNQDYESFYKEEFLYRKLAGYPPAGHIMSVLFQTRDAMVGQKLAEKTFAQVHNFAGQMIGPAPAGIGKIQDWYRTVLYLKSMDVDALLGAREQMEAYLEQLPEDKRIGPVYFDLDPLHIS